MQWDESKHPRDDIGRFTYANGGAVENEPKNKIYALGEDIDEKTCAKTPSDYILQGYISKGEKSEKEYRSYLLNILGKAATPAMVLYATTEELVNEVRKKMLEIKEKMRNRAGENFIDLAIGDWYPYLPNSAIGFFVGEDAIGMLDLAHGADMKDRSYIKDAISLDNYNDPKVGADKEYLEEKIYGQFKDYNFDINKIKGYYFKPNSGPCQRIIDNKDFQNIIREHKQEIIQKGSFSAAFKKHGPGGVFRENNFRNAIGSADFRHIYLDKEGNLHIKMYDTYDFNKTDKGRLIKAGGRQMKKGVLKPFFTIHDIIIPKSKLDEIWK